MFQDRPLWYPTSHRCPGRVQPVNYYALSPISPNHLVSYIVDHPSCIYLYTRILWEMVLKALLKSR